MAKLQSIVFNFDQMIQPYWDIHFQEPYNSIREQIARKFRMSTLTNDIWTKSNFFYTTTNGTYSLHDNYSVINAGDIIGPIDYHLPGNIMVREDDDKIVIRLSPDYYIEIQEGKVKLYGESQLKYKNIPTKEFNKYINTSDILEDFMGLIKSLKISKEEMLNLPLKLFIQFLIIKAIEEDGEEVPNDIIPIEKHPALPSPIYNKRCRYCGRFISKVKVEQGINFCSPFHFNKYWDKINPVKKAENILPFKKNPIRERLQEIYLRENPEFPVEQAKKVPYDIIRHKGALDAILW